MRANHAMSNNEALSTANLDFNRLSHAYITGGSIAGTIAMAAVCSAQNAARPCGNCVHCGKASRRTHPDISTVDKPEDKREITVDQIRDLRRDVIVVPCEAAKKAYIINDADLMNRNAQNAFLQILEEPPSHAVFILSTNTPAELLPTVRSRCVELKTRHDTESPDSAATETAKEFMSALAGSNAQLLAFMFRLEKLERERFALFLSAAHEQIAVMLPSEAYSNAGAGRETLSRAARVLTRAGEMLELNVNAGHISGFICASLMTVPNK